MRSRAILPGLVVVLLLSVTACTGGPDGPSVSNGSPSPSLVVSSSGFLYVAPGIEATFELTGSQGHLVVLNRTGFPLGRPGIYLLDARDGARVPGVVSAPERISNRETREFDVTVEGAPERKNIGIVVLLFGGDNYGAFEAVRNLP
ncbi:MAG TPA: hypothetical protein VF108_08380 [Actinomycetota bacterium]